MRSFLRLFCICLFLQACADNSCDKIKDYISQNLPQSGILKQDAKGFVYVDIDDNYICSLVDFIKDEGFVEPPYFCMDGHGAHISVIDAKEAEQYSVRKIREVGSKIFFKIKECQVVKSFYIITVEAPELAELRKRYGLPKAKYDYHITIGVKYQEAQAA